MSNAGCIEWNLKEIIERIIKKHPKIQEIYLFGSRAYNTGSLRSDIDLLAFSDGNPIPQSEINAWLPFAYPLVDLFWTYDKQIAQSAANGSAIRCREEYKDIIDQIDAIKLWDTQNGFMEFDRWNQVTLAEQNFKLSVIPTYSLQSAGQNIHEALESLERSGIKSYFAGSSWEEIGQSIVKIVETSLQKPTKFQRRAGSFSFDTIKLKNEYDFQNLIHLILRSLFPDIEGENMVITIDGNTKNADFGLAFNKLIIEAKHINSTSKKAEVIKTLEGLKSFYAENPNVKCLVFLILYEKTVEIDPAILEARFSAEYASPRIYVRFFENTYCET